MTGDIRNYVDARESLRTGLLCASMVALGVALGVNLFTAKMLVTLDLATYSVGNTDAAALNAYYDTLMRGSLATFALCSVGVAALDSGLVWAQDDSPETDGDGEGKEAGG